MKILLFGKNGQVGWELNRSLQPLGEVIALDRDEADFSRPESLREIVRKIKPDVIVNAVAYTAVDKAEAEEALAATINSIAPGVLAEEALSINALLIHYSTDYVFDGTKQGPYVETDVPKPINAYGRTKLAGEQVIQSSGCDYFIFRTSWVYASRGHNFLLTILRLAKERDELNIVADQIGSPTSARLIAETTLLCLQ
ncbi:MAG: dTDP-4-dehydrorhamnose reductase, partial [Idiomarina sp.]|nr:dTDP-4-dehydrorhamnose reductase [Idiomarina sp.]